MSKSKREFENLSDTEQELILQDEHTLRYCEVCKKKLTHKVRTIFTYPTYECFGFQHKKNLKALEKEKAIQAEKDREWLENRKANNEINVLTEKYEKELAHEKQKAKEI